MTLIGFSLPLVWANAVSRRLCGTGLALVLAASAPAVASASSEIDEALLQIEQVGPRLSATLSAVDSVVKAAADQGNSETSKGVPMLQSAVRASFDAKSIAAEISDDLAKVDDGEADPAALAKAATAFEEGRKKVASMYESQDKAAAAKIETRVASDDDGPRIKQLADLMAAPELAAETALTTQAMYVSLEAFSDPNTAELASASGEKLKSDMQGVVASLRSRTENEKPVPKDVARMDEKARLTFILATLPKADLSALADFYQSAEGKAKRQALVESYRKVSDQANTRMLGEYFSALAAYFKSNPRPQQQ